MSENVKKRNYSFENSRRLPSEKMTELNGVKIPSVPGSCYHAIICALSQNKGKFCSWDRVVELVEKYVKQYGGESAWSKFVDRAGKKGYKQRIKDNAHTLTRTGVDCYGYRLHEKGMAIYFFKDGAILFTGGQIQASGGRYDIIFPDGRKLQRRYRGTTMTYAEYKKFLECGYIDISGTLKNHDAIREYRMGLRESIEDSVPEVSSAVMVNTQVCITLSEDYDQDTADRLLALGLVVENTLDNEVIGTIPSENIASLQEDKDVLMVDVIDAKESHV